MQLRGGDPPRVSDVPTLPSMTPAEGCEAPLRAHQAGVEAHMLLLLSKHWFQSLELKVCAHMK